eukprot:maker-scaffold75_size407189-snap-gene-2.18 protein:Tk10135 transcript:maker-scaffold75_size407189-snap-gene-2.18-mRNA-1 annotation:"piezo-type mechanosensitive ion channel component 2 isoform x6"
MDKSEGHTQTHHKDPPKSTASDIDIEEDPITINSKKIESSKVPLTGSHRDWPDYLDEEYVDLDWSPEKPTEHDHGLSDRDLASNSKSSGTKTSSSGQTESTVLHDRPQFAALTSEAADERDLGRSHEGSGSEVEQQQEDEDEEGSGVGVEEGSGDY